MTSITSTVGRAGLLACVALAGCASTTGGGRDAAEPPTYMLVSLLRGEQAAGMSDAERTEIQREHMDNIRRLALEGTLLVAGPFGKDNHDPSVRGIFVFDVDTVDAARTLTDSDPAVQKGVLAMAIEPLTTDADLKAALAADIAADADAKARGVERPMSESIRAYVLVRCDDGDRIERALRAGAGADSIIVAGRTEGGRGFFILDAKETRTVREWLASAASANAGVFVDEWWSGVHLVEARRGDAARRRAASVKNS
jgi:uncharacterized protein YciI